MQENNKRTVTISLPIFHVPSFFYGIGFSSILFAIFTHFTITSGYTIMQIATVLFFFMGIFSIISSTRQSISRNTADQIGFLGVTSIVVALATGISFLICVGNRVNLTF